MQPVPGVDQVIDGLYIGGARAAAYPDVLRNHRLTRVLKLYSDRPYWPPDFDVCDNPFEDGLPIPSEALERGTVFLHEQAAAGRRVLVCCRMGRSRSATLTLAYLLECGYALPAAWALLRERHPQAWPEPALWESLLVYYALPYTLDDVRGWLNDNEAG